MVTHPRPTSGRDADCRHRQAPSRYLYDAARQHNWAALAEFARLAMAAGVELRAQDFMWTQAVLVDGGCVVHAYKHVDTGRYLHVDGSGHAYCSMPVDAAPRLVRCTDSDAIVHVLDFEAQLSRGAEQQQADSLGSIDESGASSQPGDAPRNRFRAGVVRHGGRGTPHQET